MPKEKSLYYYYKVQPFSKSFSNPLLQYDDAIAKLYYGRPYITVDYFASWKKKFFFASLLGIKFVLFIFSYTGKLILTLFWARKKYFFLSLAAFWASSAWKMYPSILKMSNKLPTPREAFKDQRINWILNWLLKLQQWWWPALIFRGRNKNRPFSGW